MAFDYKKGQTNYLEKRDGEWKVLHEHTSAAADWDGAIDE